MKIHAIRLTPGQDLKKSIVELCLQKNIGAACIISAVGSLQQLHLRLANSSGQFKKIEKFEILSLNGTVSKAGVHLHMAVANEKGDVHGGHLLDDNIVFTTCELVLIEIEQMFFKRAEDPITGFKELKIENN